MADQTVSKASRNGPVGRPGIAKCPTGIHGLDEIMGGGLPAGRPTLVCGGTGSGKTLLAMEFLVRGAMQFGEPGVFVAFEEAPAELTANVRSLGFDLEELVRQKKLHMDYIRVDRTEIVETGEYDLGGLFVRLGHAIDTLGARRVALDTLENLFGGLSNDYILRAELGRLFRWLKDKGVTAVITAERGDGALTRHGLEEYVSDCVIALDHRVTEQVSTRRLRVVKYRGSLHGTNEYPFLIGEQGISVLPITSLGLRHEVSTDRVSSGIPRLDAMLGGKGYFRGSGVLVSGAAGTGKSSIAAAFADAVCRRGERCLYLASEESQSQIVRNMRSIGIDLGPWVSASLLRFHAERPTATGLETHLATIYKHVQEFRPQAVILDPVSSYLHAGTPEQAGSMTLRLVDFLKGLQVTTLFTNLVSGGHAEEATELSVSSLIDTWLLLRNVELGGERNRVIYVVKSRGMAHSNQLREFVLTDGGIELRDVYLGPEGVLTGSMRLSQEARERAAGKVREERLARKQRMLERKRKTVEARIAALRSAIEADEDEIQTAVVEAEAREEVLQQNRARMAESRRADSAATPPADGEVIPQGGGV